MPQYLRVEVENRLLARLATYNKGGTLYDITLCVHELCTDIFLRDVDTGVQRQPQDVEGCKIDSQDDFKHARRCVAAAFTSYDELVQHLRANRPSESAKMKPIVMRLMTNNYDRGLIEANPVESGSTRVTVRIGAPGNRVKNALPRDEWQWSCEGTSISGAASHTERALMIIHSIGGSLLPELKEHENC